jgi:amino acid transporter
MSTPLSGLPDDDITRALAKDRLGVSAVVFFVMSAAAPLTVVAGVVTTGYAVTGLTGFPVAFTAIGLILALFSVGYVAMGRYLPHAGAFYAYTSHGLGKVTGVATAWMALLTYNLLQVALYGATGAAAQPLLTQYAGIELPWWVFALVAWALVTTLGLLRVDVNGTVLAVLLVAEIVLIGVYDIAFLAGPANGYALSTLSPTGLLDPGAGALLAIGVLGFTGFESSVVFSEESKNPRRTVPLATFSSIAIIAILYGISSWAMAVATGADKVVDASGESLKSGSILIFDLAANKLGPTFANLGGILFVTSIIAAMISFHNTTARYVFALGRERVLPPVFGGTSANGSPWAGSVAQSVVGLAVIVIYAAFGLDPLVQLFYTLGTAGGFGALALITVSAYAVFVYFRRNSHPEPAWRTTVAPALAIVATTGVLVLAVVNFATMLGVDETSPLRWGIPGTFVVVGVLGALYGLVLKSSRPTVYAAIGMGAKSTSSGVLTSPGSAFAVAPVQAGSVAPSLEAQP